VLRDAAVKGRGLALLPTFIAGADLRTGALTTVLAQYKAPELFVYAIYLRQGTCPSKRACSSIIWRNVSAGDLIGIRQIPVRVLRGCGRLKRFCAASGAISLATAVYASYVECSIQTLRSGNDAAPRTGHD
jgi:hypothetical protein